MEDGKKLHLRRGNFSDLAAIILIEKRSFEDPWPPEALFGELQRDGMRIALVAESQEVVCGYIMAWLVADQLHVLNIATDPDYLRQGVGTTLLREAARLAAARKAVEVTLEVRDSNHSARAFYRRHGFGEAGRRPGYYQDNGEDAIILTAAIGALLDD